MSGDKIGIIQTRGLGDNIIALPIARWYADRGNDVYWPIDSRWVDAFSYAEPKVTFIPLDHPNPAINPSEVPISFLWNRPIEAVRARGCEKLLPLYANVIQNEHLLGLEPWVKFDEYKYAVSGVPFREKWNLQIRRDHQREHELRQSLGLHGDDRDLPYAIAHLKSTGLRVPLHVASHFAGELRVIEIDERTTNPFDWLGVIEGAAKVICVDSAYCNLIEQLNLGGDDKVLFLRSDIQYTPVLKNGWQFAWLKKPDRVLDQRVYNLAEMERNGAKPRQTVGYVSR